jgi:HPr kinase/phosphorylase
MSTTLLLHATTVCLDGGAVVIRGPSGSGKSDLALQLTETATLIADDQTRLERRDNQLFASAPPRIKGLLEVRGLGIIKVATIEEAPVALIIDLVPANQIDRMPKPEDLQTELLGLTLPRLALDASTASAAMRIRMALRHITPRLEVHDLPA